MSVPPLRPRGTATPVGWRVLVAEDDALLALAMRQAVRAEEPGDAALDAAPAPGPAPDAGLALRDLARGMALLPPGQREAVALVCVEGLAYDQAAALLGISPGTLKSRLGRGRAALQAYVDGRPARRGPSRAAGPVPATRRPAPA